MTEANTTSLIPQGVVGDEELIDGGSAQFVNLPETAVVVVGYAGVVKDGT